MASIKSRVPPNASTSITYPGGSNQVTYGYDNANRLTSVTDWNSNSTTYSYDDAGRMTTATIPSSTGIAVNDDDNQRHFRTMANGKYSVLPQERPDGTVVGATDNMTAREVEAWADRFQRTRPPQ